jgi:hypothetical protein
MSKTARAGKAQTAKTALYIALVPIVGVVVGSYVLFFRAPSRRAAPDSETAAARDEARTKERELFTYGDVRRRRGEAPARFGASLPGTFEEWLAFDHGDPRFPPPSQIQDRICDGDASAIDAWHAAMKRLAGDDPERVAQTFGELLHGCREPRHCEAMRERARSSDAPVLHDVYWRALSACTDDRWAAEFETDDAPARAVVDWTAARSAAGKKVVYTPRLEAALVELAGEESAMWKIEQAAELIAWVDDQRVPEVMLRMHHAAKEPYRKHTIALSMGAIAKKSSRARALWKAACAEDEDDERCWPAEDDAATFDYAKRIRRGELPTLVVQLSADLAEIERQTPPDMTADFLSALAGCVSGDVWDEDRWARPRCLDRLAALDRERAAATASAFLRSASEDELPYDFRATLHSLQTYRTVEEMQGRLDALGFTTVPGTPARPEPIVDVFDALAARGRGRMLPQLGAGTRKDYDRLARQIAALVKPELDEAKFEELLPAFNEGVDGVAVRGYRDGLRFEARVSSEYGDPTVPVGLVNEMLRDAGSETRCLELSGPQSETLVVCGPREGLVKLVEEKVLANVRELASLLDTSPPSDRYDEIFRKYLEEND